MTSKKRSSLLVVAFMAIGLQFAFPSIPFVTTAAAQSCDDDSFDAQGRRLSRCGPGKCKNPREMTDEQFEAFRKCWSGCIEKHPDDVTQQQECAECCRRLADD